jgi:glycine/serine hydroxymethyltransferase
MKIKHISLLIAALAFAAPFSSEAYFTTAQSATAVSPQTGIFEIEYAFGLNEADILMPVLAKWHLPHESAAKEVGFDLLKNNDYAAKDGQAVGIVLANAPIENGMYRIAKGGAKKMTLMVFYTAPQVNDAASYALQVTRLPFYVENADGTLDARALNTPELQYYISPALTLPAAASITTH